jgi:hypothetical protein
MSASTNALPGYTIIPKANQTLAERDDVVVNKFEVIDLKNMSKSEILVNHTSSEDLEIIDKEAKTIDTANQGKKAKKNNNIIKLKNADTETKVEEDSSKEVVFVTPYTEITVNAFEVFIDKNVFSVLTDTDDRVKVRPNRGIELSAKFSENVYNLYSSGVYIPISKLNATLSVFFIVDEIPEP